MRKIVVSLTISLDGFVQDPEGQPGSEWFGPSPIGASRAQVRAEIVELKQQVEGDIVVYGDIHLVRELLEHDLVDELRLTIFPDRVGSGERLLAQVEKPMRLVESGAVGRGLAFLTYVRAGDEDSGRACPR